ncbi:MAG TPA: peptidase S8, partial [Balneolaceae bacterium]|nr:peptidase S8 [Balneolaceae bacterium]
PFNPTTNITYNLPEAASNLTVKVYNVLGKEVATLVSAQSQRAGQHQVSFDASGLSSGVYIYRVESAQFTASKKMMLIK